MNKLPYVVFFIIFFIPFFARGLGILPGSAVLLIELTSGAILLIALIYCAYRKSLSVSPKYLILFVIVCLHFTVGAIFNSMDPGVVFSGLRSYIRYMPFFLLPLVYSFTDKEMMGQFKFLVSIGLLQLPLVVTQFFILGWGKDLISGTFGVGSFMSIFMVSTIILLTAFYFRERITGKTFLILALLIFIPTTLNESKGTFILLVVGFLSIMLGANLKRSQLIMASSILVIMLSVFTVIYNMYFHSVQGTGGLIAFFTKNQDTGLINYLFSGDATEVDAETVLEPGSSMPGALPSFDSVDFKSRRIDAIILALRALSNDPVRLLLGVGIGNASTSKVNLFIGQYSFLDEHSIIANALSRFLWEIGILGVFLYLLFFGLVYRDSRYLARTNSLPGTFALGWAGVVLIVIMTLPYKNIFVSEALSVLLWYLSGYIAAKSFALRFTSNTQMNEEKSIMPQLSATYSVNQQSIHNKIQ